MEPDMTDDEVRIYWEENKHLIAEWIEPTHTPPSDTPQSEVALKWRLHTAFNHALAYKNAKPHQKERALSMLLSVLDAQMFVMDAENDLELDALIEADEIIRKAIGVTDATLSVMGEADSHMMDIPEVRTTQRGVTLGDMTARHDKDIENAVKEMIGDDEE